MPAFKDLTHKTFNRLTVVKDSGRRTKSGSVIWECKCACGNLALVEGYRLRKSLTKSCGCLQKEVLISVNEKQLQGNRFGKLTVIQRFEGSDEKKKYLWECKCDCGNVAFVSTGALTSKHTKSCGCLQKEKFSEIKEDYLERDAKEGTLLASIKEERKLNKNNNSGVKGVHWEKQTQKWRASIQIKGEDIKLGRFVDKKTAIEARKKAEEKYFKPMLEKYNR